MSMRRQVLTMAALLCGLGLVGPESGMSQGPPPFAAQASLITWGDYVDAVTAQDPSGHNNGEAGAVSDPAAERNVRHSG